MTPPCPCFTISITYSLNILKDAKGLHGQRHQGSPLPLLPTVQRHSSLNPYNFNFKESHACLRELAPTQPIHRKRISKPFICSNSDIVHMLKFQGICRSPARTQRLCTCSNFKKPANDPPVLTTHSNTPNPQAARDSNIPLSSTASHRIRKPCLFSFEVCST